MSKYEWYDFAADCAPWVLGVAAIVGVIAAFAHVFECGFWDAAAGLTVAIVVFGGIGGMVNS